MKKLLIALSFLVLSIPIQLYADAPLDTMKSCINQVLAVLRDPALQGESANEAKKKKLRPIFDNTFDYTELSKSTLARNWDRLTPEQREEFETLYKALLEKVYMNTILSYKKQEIVFGKERSLGQNRAEVETKIVSPDKETPVNFRLVSKNGEWRVYDIVIENISLVTNYRSQFNRVLSKDTPQAMLVSLRKTVDGN